MTNDQKNTIRHWINTVAYTFGQVVFYVKWSVAVAITCLVWGGALWFGSLAWDQKQGAVLAMMGFGAWLAVCRFVFPVFWFVSIEVIRRFFGYISSRFW
jgi:hypothetical protein